MGSYMVGSRLCISHLETQKRIGTLHYLQGVLTFVTVLAKTNHVHTKTEFNFIAAVYRHTQYLSIPVYQVLNVNWSAFLKGILPTLQSHS